MNKSNNNSSCSNSNSNSIYNKKKIGENEGVIGKNKEDKNISPLKQIISVTQKDSNNVFKKINKNSKSQILFLTNNSKKNLNELDAEGKLKLKASEEKRKNNFTSHSTIIVKKPKNTSPIFSTKHHNKNKISIELT